jgi:hypothetical protein
MERDGWILLLAATRDRARGRLEEKRAQLADPEFRRLYCGFDEAVDWDPADPRLEQLADDLVRYLERQGATEESGTSTTPPSSRW